MKIPRSKLFQRDYLFPGGSTYLLENKYWQSSYFSGEYLLTVIPVWQRAFVLKNLNKILRYLLKYKAQSVKMERTYVKNLSRGLD